MGSESEEVDTDVFSGRLSKLVETISRKPVPAHQKNLILEITAEDQNPDEEARDVEVPYVMVKLAK